MDNQIKTSEPARRLINVNKPSELSNWSDKFYVTHGRLKAAVNTVGNSAGKVESYLKKNNKK
ncbi:DUF3606 domain-containing protein [Mucilaginibacter sp. UYCu711]|uniref:DUF3606 domain-containing protein n=1 Tax=Mucilaginibacter sp. UYCu711 TaxID=3156339 RepID=UPI003D203C60